MPLCKVRQPGIAAALERLPAFQSEPGLLVFGLASSPSGPPPEVLLGSSGSYPITAETLGQVWGCPLQKPLCQQVLGTKRSVAMCRCHPSACPHGPHAD